MNVEETKVRLNAGDKQRIAALVGENRMAAYIREAVTERLARDEAAGASVAKERGDGKR